MSKKLIDIQTAWGKVLFWLIIILSSIALLILTGLWGAAAFFKSDTKILKIYIGIYILLSLLINLVITRRNRRYLLVGILLPIIFTVLFWRYQM